MKYTWSIFAICFLSLQAAHSQKVINPKAKRYYDLAIDSAYSNGDQGLQTAIGFLNQAIKIDYNYFNAYYNKFMFQNQLRQYDKAILTGKQMVRLRPKNVDVLISVGDVYERRGDTVTSLQYFNRGLSIYNAILDTMKVINKSYKTTQVGKAIALILLHQPDKAKAILTELYYKEPDANYKQLYRHFMVVKRSELIEDKPVTTVQ